MRRISRRRLFNKNNSYALGALLLIIAVLVQYAQVVVRAAVSYTPATISSVTSGSSHSCGIASGAAYCWGDNSSGQLGNNSTTQSLVPVAVNTAGVLSGKTVTAIAAGTGFTCAIAAGAAYCWGLNTNGQLGNNSTTQSLVPVAVTASGVLSGKTVTAISTGASHACAIASGAAYCWGLNTNGQLGNNSTAQSLVPVAVTASGVLSGKTVTDISAGASHTCVVATKVAYCWGLNTNGQLGNNSTTQSLVPVAVYTRASYKQQGTTYPASPLYQLAVNNVSAGASHTCVIATSFAYCWGLNANGQLGDNSTTQSLVPVAVDTSGVLQGSTVVISAGASHTCVVASSAAYCWGLNANGQLGNNSTTQSSVPVAVTASGVLSGTTVTDISAGASHSCVVASNAAYCWGSNTNGRLGNNSTTQSLIPVVVSSILIPGTEPASSAASRFYSNANSAQPGGVLADTNQPATLAAGGDAFRLRTGIFNGLQATNNYNFTDIDGGSDSTCAVASGAAYCWGDNTYGEIGNNSNAYQLLVPAAVDTTGLLSAKTVTDIAVANHHTCAVASGAAYCWGLGSDGQLGDNSIGQSFIPVAVDTTGVLAGKTVTAIDNADGFTCAVASGSAYCWGLNTNGQLGNNSTTESSVPVAVDTTGVLAGKTVTAISTGQGYSCAVAAGAVYCWGINTNGVLGNNSTTQSLIPVAVDTTGVLAGKTVTAISAGSSHACVVASGAAYCWGAQSFNELGNNSGTGSSVPVAVDTSGALAGKTITAVTAGVNHTCVTASSTAYCWGYNYYGATGNNSATPALVDTSGVLAGKSITAISAGSDHTCVIGSNALYCWGYNYTGELGNNSTNNSSVPVAVNAPGAPPPNLASLRANDNSFSLQYAQKTAATCSAQTTGFTDVSTNTTIAWNTNSSVTDGSTITANANDPTAAADTVYQTYVSGGTTFTNSQDIPVSKNALWDFSLKDNSGLSKTSFCFKIVYANGSDLEQYTNYPEVTTASVGLNLSYVDNTGTPIALPTFSMAPTNLMNTCQTSTGTLGSTGGNKLRVTQDGTSANGWNVSIAPTDGSTGLWKSSDNSAFYDFNDSSGSPPGCNSGSDGDGYAGRLSFDTSHSIVTPQAGCSTTGLSWDSGLASYDAGAIGAITLLAASSSSSPNCYWDISDTKATQTIPAQQPSGNYDLQLTATVVAQ